MKLWRSLLVTACVGTLLVAAAGNAQNITTYTLASGERGRSYHDVFGANLVKLLKSFRLKNRATGGSIENLELLADGRVDLGFVQSDVYAQKLRAKGARYGALTAVGRLVEECIYIVRRRGGPIQSLSDLGKQVDGHSARIAVGPEGSGMEATWKLLSKLEPALSKTKLVHTAGVLSVNQLGLGMTEAVGWVSDPDNRSHAMLRAVAGSPELELLAIADPKLEYTLQSGTPIYRLRKVALTDVRDPILFPTLCTESIVLARADANPRLVEAASQALSLKREKVLNPH
jgi:TRAP-type uncharacterized transport system substrate-binding protein